MPSLSKTRFNSRSSVKSSVKSSKLGESGESSNGVWLVIGLLIVLILVVIIVSVFYKKYEKFTNKPTYRLEYYYMTNCPHCEDFNPTWEKLTSTEKENLKSMGVVEFGKYELNGTKKEDNEKVKKYNVTGAPTILLVDTSNADKYYNYEGNRQVEDIKTFITEKTK